MNNKNLQIENFFHYGHLQLKFWDTKWQFSNIDENFVAF